MAFAGEAWCRPLGRVGEADGLGDAFDSYVDLPHAAWTKGGAPTSPTGGSGPAEPKDNGAVRAWGAHKWHSAEFRSTHALQSDYWQILVSDKGFQLIELKDLPK